MNYVKNKQERDKNSSLKKTELKYKILNSSLLTSVSRSGTRPRGFWQYQPSSVVLAIKEGIGTQDKTLCDLILLHFCFHFSEPAAQRIEVRAFATKRGLNIKATNGFGDPAMVSVDVCFMACNIQEESVSLP